MKRIFSRRILASAILTIALVIVTYLGRSIFAPFIWKGVAIGLIISGTISLLNISGARNGVIKLFKTISQETRVERLLKLLVKHRKDTQTRELILSRLEANYLQKDLGDLVWNGTVREILYHHLKDLYYCLVQFTGQVHLRAMEEIEHMLGQALKETSPKARVEAFASVMQNEVMRMLYLFQYSYGCPQDTLIVIAQRITAALAPLEKSEQKSFIEGAYDAMYRHDEFTANWERDNLTAHEVPWYRTTRLKDRYGYELKRSFSPIEKGWLNRDYKQLLEKVGKSFALTPARTT